MCDILRKFDIDSLYICPPHLYTVATLPWEIQKSHFSSVLFIHTSDYLCYLRKKQTVTTLPTTPEKCHHTTLLNAKLLHLTADNAAFLQMLVTLKRAGCGLALVALKMTDQINKKTDHRIGLRR